MVSYSVAIRSASSAGSEPSAPTGTGVVGVCKTGSPTMRMGTTAMTGKLKARVPTCSGCGASPGQAISPSQPTRGSGFRLNSCRRG